MLVENALRDQRGRMIASRDSTRMGRVTSGSDDPVFVRARRAAFVIVSCLAALSCTVPTDNDVATPTRWEIKPAASIDDGASYWPAAHWRTALPSQVAMDSSAMATLSRDVRSGKYPTMHSLLVVRHGYLVLNEYVAGVEPESLQKTQEVTTTISGLLVGMAVDRGKLRIEDQVAIFFPEYANLFGGQMDAIRVDGFLTMTSELDFWDEPYEGSPLQALNTHSGDWLQLIFSQGASGSRFMFNSGGIIALGGVLRAVLGEPADSFARRELFQPLGIDRTCWNIGAPKGLPHMAAGLSLTSPDMARIGYLMLRDGRWKDAQIVSAGWLARMRERKSKNLFNWATHPVSYGRTLWILPPIDGVDVFAASGVYGQWIFVVPARDLVVVATGHGSLSDFKIPIQLLYDVLIPSSH